MEFQFLFNILVVILFIFIIFKKSNENYTNISKQDLEGLQNLSSMYKNGELKIAKLHVTDDAQFDKKISSKNITATEKITSEHLHVNDHSYTKRLDIKGKHGTTHFNHQNDGNTYLRDNVYVHDYLKTSRLDINGKRGITHFNHDNKGNTYLRDNIQDTADLVKFGNNFYLFQIDGWGGNRYVHGHKGDRIGVAQNQYKTKFRIDK
tara:strand:- start:191 stop:808 length:618 start_codon:yes stop_codon:yes gene_type:complete